MASIGSAFKAIFKKKHPAARSARVWSNSIIAQIAPLVSGDVINVSAWRDEDKEGRTYRDYFGNARSYTVSNYVGWRGTEGGSDLELDLSVPLGEEWRGRFDLVFNHTTLEHVFDITLALRTLCELSRDAVLIVVPFIQHLHGPEDGDFWRPSPYAMRRMFASQGYSVLVETAGPERGRIRYVTYLATRDPAVWRGRLPLIPRNAEAVLRYSGK